MGHPYVVRRQRSGTHLTPLALTPSKYACRPLKRRSSKGPWNASCRQYAMKVSEASTKAQRLPWWGGCSWTQCMAACIHSYWRCLTTNDYHSMLGSLTFYRRLLHENVFTKQQLHAATPPVLLASETSLDKPTHKLPAIGHAIAGVMAGFTVSFIAAPVEHVKARLQIQYAVDKRQRFYHGPIDCTTRIVCYSNGNSKHH